MGVPTKEPCNPRKLSRPKLPMNVETKCYNNEGCTKNISTPSI